MNITDFPAPPRPDNFADALRLIFERQRLLMEKYREIEKLPTAPVSLHHADGQRIIKDFAWRMIEELAESGEAWKKHGNDVTMARLHALEELADAWHFFVELLIFAGVTADDCLSEPASFQPGLVFDVTMAGVYWPPTYRLGIAMNFLRNKAWKSTQMPTDERRFKKALIDTYAAMLHIWFNLGEDWDMLFEFYFKKSEVNRFRQRSNY